ncbi:hydroxyethylthiazole kinase, partial [Salmonella enterica subsp. enterica serovar Oslo]
PLLTRIVGTGCALSAVVAASCAFRGAALDNVASACCWMKLAGQGAAVRRDGPGSFIAAFLEALYLLDMEAATATDCRAVDCRL